MYSANIQIFNFFVRLRGLLNTLAYRFSETFSFVTPGIIQNLGVFLRSTSNVFSTSDYTCGRTLFLVSRFYASKSLGSAINVTAPSQVVVGTTSNILFDSSGLNKSRIYLGVVFNLKLTCDIKRLLNLISLLDYSSPAKFFIVRKNLVKTLYGKKYLFRRRVKLLKTSRGRTSLALFPRLLKVSSLIISSCYKELLILRPRILIDSQLLVRLKRDGGFLTEVGNSKPRAYLSNSISCVLPNRFSRLSYSRAFLAFFTKLSPSHALLSRIQSITFRKVRAVRKIFLRSNARRLGIFPKRNKGLKRMY